MTSDEPDPTPTGPDEVCGCGHTKAQHIYHEGACRPAGIECPCLAFTPAPSEKRRLKVTRTNHPFARPLPDLSTDQMEALLDLKAPGWRDDLPKMELMPVGDPYWKQRAFELGHEVLDLRLEVQRLKGLVIGCDCGIIHEAYAEARDAVVEAQVEIRRLQS